MRFTSSNALCSLLLLGGAVVASPLAQPFQDDVVVLEDRDEVTGRAVPIGQAIFKCTVPGTVALTFDDGPFTYTQRIMDLLLAANMRATFFVNGDNWSLINNRVPELKRMIAQGFQIGSHTWSHPDMATLNDAQIRNEMIRLETTLKSLIGKFPTYMRPPYFSYNANTLATLKNLGYRVIHADIDTLDWQYNTPATTATAAQRFLNGLNAGGRLALAHDVHATTSTHLVPKMIQIIKSKGLKAVTVGQCLGDPYANWYRATRTTTTPPPTTNPPTGTVDPKGSCGGANRYVCKTGLCCSQYGWCGSTAEYCSAGCQRTFGICK